MWPVTLSPLTDILLLLWTWLQFRVPEWKPKWSDRVDGLRWYFYELQECRL